MQLPYIDDHRIVLYGKVTILFKRINSSRAVAALT